MTTEQDKHILKIGIEKLGGQAQYDFLIGYFDEIRNRTRKETIAEVERMIIKFDFHSFFPYPHNKSEVSEILREELKQQLEAMKKQ